MDKIKFFWENCSLNFAHNEISGHLISYEKITNFWKNNFIEKIDFNESIILDYGIGGGYLGKYLFENKKINKYYGIDISERSLIKASEILENKNIELMNTENYYNNFNDRIDIFICQSCIQHFITKEYLINFLRKITSLKPKIIMLQIAYSEETKFIENNNYNEEKNVVRACYTNKEFILEFLENYYIFNEGEILENNYQFLIFHNNHIVV